MLATESARNPLARSKMASYAARGQLNGSNSSFGSSSAGTLHSNRFTSSSGTSTSTFSSPEAGLFPPPLPSSAASTMGSADSSMPAPKQNIMNRRAGTDSSLYQICINLKKRLSTVPGFHEHIVEMDEEEALESDFIDPVTCMWNSLRRGFPLMTVFNALQPKTPLYVDPARYAESKIGKAATFQFLQACLNDLKIPSNETFLITDLYGEDTTGFVKVTKCVNKVLDVLQQRGFLLQRSLSTTDPDPSAPQTMTHRQKIVEEFVKTERDYVQHLEILQHFKNEVENGGVIAGDAAHDIFLNLNALLDFQRRFLIRIEQQNSLSEAQQDWGKLLYHYKESFRVYEPFIANQNRCRQTVEKQWDKLSKGPLPPEVRDIVDTPATLLSFLLKPFQRLTKYPMLLRELRDKGGLDEQRRKNLDDGIAAAESILHRANDAIHKEQRIAAVQDLQQRVEDWKGHKIDHFGELLLHGNYTVLKGEGSKEVEREYKVYLFERILLCCKEIDLNKPKNKILGNKAPLMDKKGQPKLQLKGRIFMQNVTDVLTFKKAGELNRNLCYMQSLQRACVGSYTLQIYWKGDPGIENFVIRFGDERTMTQWEKAVQHQKEYLIESARKSGMSGGTSSTEFVSMQGFSRPENPYHEADEEEDDYSSQSATMTTSKMGFSEGRNASNNSLRSVNGQPGSLRAQQIRYPHPTEPAVGNFAPPLSVNTNVPAGTSSPGEFAANSYFSPTNDSPLSSRSSGQASMYGFPRQQLPPAGWSYETSKHRTVPVMPRAPSRDGVPGSARPSLPAMSTSQYMQAQLAQTQNRLRSVSTPDINGPGRRPMNGQGAEHVPVPPVPAIMRNPLSRSNTGSPLDINPSTRGSTQSPPLGHQMYNSGGVNDRLPRYNDGGDLPRHTLGNLPIRVPPQQITSNPMQAVEKESLYPSQLKVKIQFDPAPSHVTIVVPITIKYRTLIDRIDSKMVRVSSASIAKGSARLRYRDRDDDLIVIKTDEDVSDSIEEWGAVHETKLRQGVVDDFELFWQERSERV